MWASNEAVQTASEPSNPRRALRKMRRSAEHDGRVRTGEGDGGDAAGDLTDYSMRADPPERPERPPRRSSFDSLKHAAVNPAAGWVSAIVMAVTAITTAWKTDADNDSTARTSYETLRDAVQRNAAASEACRNGLIDTRAWVQELSMRFEQRSAATEVAVDRKVTRAAAAPLPPRMPAPPVPQAPPVPAEIEPSPLPTFEALALKSNHE